MSPNISTSSRKKNFNFGITSSVFAIALGLLIGFLILLICNPSQAAEGFLTIITGALSEGTYGIGMVFYYATPIICTGLSVGFAFKTGLFNIGASGQFTMGGFAAVFVGLTFVSLGKVHWIVALLAAVFAGALWALLVGVLKAYMNINEVISSIMLNYIGMYIVNWAVLKNPTLYDSYNNRSKPVATSAIIPRWGLNTIFTGSYVNAGFIIAIVVAIVIYIILNKTTFGYELRAVGLNRNASKYAGINEKKSIILSMTIAGGLSGLGGGLLYLAGSGKHIEVIDELASAGFDGISVALLGLSNPIGILFAGLFIAYIKQGGFYLQLYEFSQEIIDIIIAVIIYFSAFALFVRAVMTKFSNRFASKKLATVPDTASMQIPAPLDPNIYGDEEELEEVQEEEEFIEQDYEEASKEILHPEVVQEEDTVQEDDTVQEEVKQEESKQDGTKQNDSIERVNRGGKE